jgi:membrane associated rhomboid family serine protease
MLFFILPVGVEYRARRWPVVTFTLMGLCVLVYLWSLYLWFAGEEQYLWWLQTFWLIPQESRLHTWLTTMFVHGDIFHLLGNLVYLFLFGACVEDLIGRWRYTVFFLLGGLASSFTHIALTPGHFDSELPLGGASGAISACMGAFVLLLHRTRIEFKYFGLILLRPFSGDFFLPAWLVLSFWFVKDLFWAVMDATKGREGGGTAFGAHVGGFALGLAVIGLLKLWRRVREHKAAVRDAATDDAPLEQSPVGFSTAEVYVFQNDTQYGPYPFDHVRQCVRNGSILPQAYYWHDGLPEWRSVQELLTTK